MTKAAAGNVLLLTMIPDIPQTTETSFRCQAQRDALITTLGLLKYRDEKGNLPADLQELISAGYISELPMDPYSDTALVYKRAGNGFTLYSIGLDFQDNGGKPSGKLSPEAEGGDFVFWPAH